MATGLTGGNFLPRNQQTLGPGNYAINTAIPGLPGLTKNATDIIGNLLTGLPSPDQARQENAYFGAGSGLDPTSDFLRNRGYDLYGQKAEQRKQTGLQDLLALIGGYSGTVAPTPGQQIGQEESQADRAQRAAEAAMQDALGTRRQDFEENAYWGISPKGVPSFWDILGGGGFGGGNPYTWSPGRGGSYQGGVTELPPQVDAYGNLTSVRR